MTLSWPPQLRFAADPVIATLAVSWMIGGAALRFAADPVIATLPALQKVFPWLLRFAADPVIATLLFGGQP